MNMMKFSPARRMFESPFFNSLPVRWDDFVTGKDFAGYVPSVNVSENEKEWHIEVSAAGFKKEDFSVKVENDILEIKAEHKSEEKKEEKNYTRREFSYGSFSRSFRLPQDSVNTDGIAATYENGILNLVLPKKSADKKDKSKEIAVG